MTGETAIVIRRGADRADPEGTADARPADAARTEAEARDESKSRRVI